MGFEDLAKHMAARDGRKKSQSKTSDGDQILAEALEADRRMNRTRDLVLGPLLLVGGVGITALSFLSSAGGGLVVCAYGAIGVGLVRTIRGLSGRS